MFHVAAFLSQTRAKLQINISMRSSGEGMQSRSLISPPLVANLACKGLLWRGLSRTEVFGFDAFPFTGLEAIKVACHFMALRRMVFVRFQAIGEMESITVGFIAGLLQQIGTPERHCAMSIEPPGTKHASRQIIGPAGHNNKSWLSRGHGNDFDVAVEKIFLHDTVDLRGQDVAAACIGIDSDCCRPAKPEIGNHRVCSRVTA